MLLTVLKHGEQRAFLGKMFKTNGPAFEKLIMGFMRVVWKKQVGSTPETGLRTVAHESLRREGRKFPGVSVRKVCKRRHFSPVKPYDWKLARGKRITHA